jgi:hypothetical protein
VVVILIALFIILKQFNPDYLIRDSKPLLSSNGQVEIKAELLDFPGSSRYFYEGWLYIQNNAPVYSVNVLFNRCNDLVVGLLGSTLNIYVNTTLKGGSGVNNDGILDTSGITPIISIPDFPFQKWVQLVVYVDGMTIDAYLDGRLIKSVKNATPIGVIPENAIKYGNKYTLGNITRFRRPAESVNPQKVWNSYMLGSGQSNSASQYHLNAQLTKNKQVRVDQRLF